MSTEPATSALDVAIEFGRTLEDLGIEYFLGGSMASSLQGEPRSTNDIDFVVDLKPRHVERLAERLGTDFEVQNDQLHEAIRLKTTSNIFYLPLVTKIDIFVLGDSEFDRSEFSRRRRVTFETGASLVIKSAEDSLLRKLVWFREGGGVSDRQWRDVLGILRVGEQTLDRSYLTTWAARLDLADLFERALCETPSE